jgi:hypothetical protein
MKFNLNKELRMKCYKEKTHRDDGTWGVSPGPEITWKEEGLMLCIFEKVENTTVGTCTRIITKNQSIKKLPPPFCPYIFEQIASQPKK